MCIPAALRSFTNTSYIVQKWISVLLGVYGAANLAVSRKPEKPFLIYII